MVPGRAGRCAAFRPDVKENIDSGRLVHILPEYFQPANIWAVYVSRLATSAKVRVTVEFLRDYFREHYGETGAASENPPRP